MPPTRTPTLNSQGAADFLKLVASILQYLPRRPGSLHANSSSMGGDSGAYAGARWQRDVDKHLLLRISTFASMVGLNPFTKWDNGFCLEACDVFLEVRWGCGIGIVWL